MNNAHYDFVVLPRLPSILTVVVPGIPTIALAGNAFGSNVASSGVAKKVEMKRADGIWSLSVETEDDKTIVVCGDKIRFSGENPL